MSDAQIVEADWTWTGEAFESGVQIQLSADGRIEQVGKLGARPTRRLRGQALLPGMINAHSHAFQRGLRGRGEHFRTGAGSFWTWREAMYELVDTLDAEAFRRLSLYTFQEMLHRGITSVGEFHYFHHTRGKIDYAFDHILLDTAREVGIRLVLLTAYYNTGGIGQPLGPTQQRFRTASPDEYWNQLDRLAAQLNPSTESIGAVVHSIRAASLDDLSSIYTEARERNIVFHMHVEEQRKEIEECTAAYGRRPLAGLNDTLDITGNFTAVHCTHSDGEDMDRFLEAGGNVCICPLTEANLGDGIPDLSRTRTRTHPDATDGRLSLGTDSNARISMIEELRWLEYAQRLKSETRGVLADASGNVGKELFRAATTGGARALRLDAGKIDPGQWADFFTIDLGTPAFAGCDETTLLDAFVFGAGNEVVSATCVGGRWRDHRPLTPDA